MAARRSRTGCATCRKRKLKCDEAKPVCGQCTKSRRECVPSDGVAFRHEQNAGLNSESQEGERSLGNFFKYRNNYTPEQMRNFIQTPQTLEWRYITDVYADDTEQMSPRHRSSPQAWQRALEALSAAAAENQAYQPPVTYADISNLLGGSNGGYGPAGSSIQGPNQNNNIKFLLNPSSTPAAMIDPNLDTTALESMREATEDQNNESSKSKHDSDDKANGEPQNVTNEEQVAFLLKNYDEQQAA